MYCGDETGSFIGDVGSHTCKFGYGGEDNPKYVGPSIMASTLEDPPHRYIPTSCYQGRLASQSLHPVMRLCNNDGEHEAPQVDANAYWQQGDSINNWDALEQLWETSFDVLRAKDKLKHTKGGGGLSINSSNPGKSSNGSPHKSQTGSLVSTTIRSSHGNGEGKLPHPVLVVTPGTTHVVGTNYEAAVNRKQQIELSEFMMEHIEAPALFLAPTPMLSAFAVGRQTALVVDVGAGGCRVTPVVDGLLLKNAQRRNGRGGDWLGNVQWRALLEERVVVRPRFLQRQTASEKKTSSPFLFRWGMQDLMYEFRTSAKVNLSPGIPSEPAPFVSKQKEDQMELDPTPGNTYELPDGTLVDLSTQRGQDLCRIPELLFSDELPFAEETSKFADQISEHPSLSTLPLHKLIHASLSAVGDADSRKDLANSVVLSGGSSLFPNLEQRLSLELPRVIPSVYKCRVIASRSNIERSCSAWIGGSVLTSLGSFQQLWLSRTEYEEYGADLSVQRFP